MVEAQSRSAWEEGHDPLPEAVDWYRVLLDDGASGARHAEAHRVLAYILPRLTVKDREHYYERTALMRRAVAETCQGAKHFFAVAKPTDGAMCQCGYYCLVRIGCGFEIVATVDESK